MTLIPIAHSEGLSLLLESSSDSFQQGVYGPSCASAPRLIRCSSPLREQIQLQFEHRSIDDLSSLAFLPSDFHNHDLPPVVVCKELLIQFTLEVVFAFDPD